MNRKAIIFGIKGYQLTIKEKYLLKEAKPWGIILFSRNIKNIFQLKTLIDNIQKILGDKKYPILIDQEGGEVSRLNKIIGSRSFSKNPKDIIRLGKLCINLHERNKIATVIKHIPGLGLSKSDTHYKKPIIKASKKELIKTDFKTFRSCESFFAMTAHVVYSIYDPDNTATHCKLIINNVIRNDINFKGILISDDISMKSLKYDLIKNATKALHAGCNLVLHCNGNIKEMRKLSKVIPKIDKFTQKKTSHFYKFLG